MYRRRPGTRSSRLPTLLTGIAVATLVAGCAGQPEAPEGTNSAASASTPTSAGIASTPSSTASRTATSAPPSPSNTSPSSTSPTAHASTQPSTGSPSGGSMITVPVYYQADSDLGPRLYREFHRVAGSGGALRAAITEMLSAAPIDPDYNSVWPAGTKLRSVKVSGSLATVDLSAYPRVGSSFESIGVQQLVYTATAADRRITSVRLRVNGAVPSSGHLDLSKPLKRANSLDTQAWVWILAPAQNATSRSPVTIRVYGTGYEGNTILRFFSGSKQVAQVITTTSMGSFSEASASVKLPAGRYTVRSYTDSGLDASLTPWDTKQFTVR